MMKQTLKLLAVVATLCASATVYAQQGGRYQAVPLSQGMGIGGDTVIIIDTVAGHMWTWSEAAATGSSSGGRYIIYQGRVRPGSKMGDVIDKQEW